MSARHVYVTVWHASISQSWMQELIPIFWQMTDMVVDYSLEPFWVPDLHPRSQERPPKSRRGSWFFQKNVITFLNFSRCFREFGNEKKKKNIGNFLKKWPAKFPKFFFIFFFYIFRFFGWPLPQGLGWRACSTLKS